MNCKPVDNLFEGGQVCPPTSANAIFYAIVAPTLQKQKGGERGVVSPWACPGVPGLNVNGIPPRCGGLKCCALR